MRRPAGLSPTRHRGQRSKTPAACCSGSPWRPRRVLKQKLPLSGASSLTWALERKGWTFGRVFRFWDPNYYRTYADGAGNPSGFMSVQSEVTRALPRPEDFVDVPADALDRDRKVSGTSRDTWDDDRAAFVVRDGNYVSARWPGDAHTFARLFANVLAEHHAQESTVATAWRGSRSQ